MNRARAVLPLLSALAACATPGASTGGALLFSGGDRDWGIEVRDRTATLRERVGGKVWIYEDLAPISEPITGGVRYHGVLRREYVIARMVEADELAYTLDIVAAGCSPAAPATITLQTATERDPAFKRSACGRAGRR